MTSHVLDAGIPARWGAVQRCKNACIYACVRALAALLLALPRRWTESLARVLAEFAHALAGRERRLAVAQLQSAFPTQPRATCKRLARQMFQHLGACIAELAHVDAWLKAGDAVVFSPGARAALDAALARQKGVVLVAGHIGNWELMAQALAHAGYPLCTIAKPLYDPRLTRWVHKERARHGMEIIWRGDARSAKSMLQVFRQGRMLGVLIDQDTTDDTAFVPFFGRLAATPTAAATLALRFGAPVVVVWSHRVLGAGRAQHVIHCQSMPDATAIGSDADHATRKQAVATMTEHMSKTLEEAIRSVPSQWVWLHRRWRRQPIAP